MGFNLFFMICGILAITLNSAILLKLARSHSKSSRLSRYTNNESTSSTASTIHHPPSTLNSSVYSINVPSPALSRNVRAHGPTPNFDRAISGPVLKIPSLPLPPTPNLPFKQSSVLRAQSETHIGVRPETVAINPILLEMEERKKMESNDYEELVIACSVCFYHFDETIRKPKWLPCDHTICLLCLMVW